MTRSSSRAPIWPWPMAKVHSGTSSREPPRGLLDRMHAVVQEEDLAAAVLLAQERLADQLVVLGVRRGASRSPGGPAAASESAEMSRTPESDMCSVRGIGVAESVSTSTVARSSLKCSLCVDAEALLLVDDHQPEVLEAHVLREDPVRADQRRRSRPRATRASRLALGSPVDRAREQRDLDREVRQALAEGLRSAAARAPSSARAPRPARRPGATRKAARTASSVLPKPTSPHRSRSIGRSRREVALDLARRRGPGRRVSV